MSFTRMAPNPRDVKPRCHRCGNTRNVRPMILASMRPMDLCGKCRTIVVNEESR
jgi:hypothetical protein